MRILCTGGAGYLGAVLVPKLLTAGHDVTVLDTFMYGDTSLAQYCSHPRFDVHRVDCRDPAAMKPYLKDADAVLPLACLVGAPICYLNPIDAEILNQHAQIELLNMLSPSQLVIFPSTESVYGKNPKLCTEETPAKPLVTYGTQKLEVEKALEKRGANSISFRMATLFGMSPRMRLDLMVNDFTWRAVKDRSLVVFEGSAMRTMLHVADAANAFVHCLSMAPEKHEVYNVGSIFVDKVGLCEAIKKQVPEFCYVESQFSADPDKRDYTVSDAKIQETGFRPTMTLEAGITELLKGYRMLSNSKHSNMP